MDSVGGTWILCPWTSMVLVGPSWSLLVTASKQGLSAHTHTFQAVMALRLATLASSGLKSSGILNSMPPGSLKGCRK